MELCDLFKQYMQHLFAGKRCEARELLFAAHDRGITASKLLHYIIWPAMEQIDKLYRQDHISRIVEHMASRINRMLGDQLQGLLARKPKTGRRMVVLSGKGEIQELCAQMTADLFEADGWCVWFLGCDVPNDEVLQFLGQVKPDILCFAGSNPFDVPEIRKLISLIREVGVCQQMQVLTVGGVFTRADSLSEEIRADLWARNAREALELVAEHPMRVPKPDLPEPGRRRKCRRAMAVGAGRRVRTN